MHRSIRALPALGAALLLATAAAGAGAVAMPTAAFSAAPGQQASASPTASGHDHGSMDDKPTMDHSTPGDGSMPGMDHGSSGGSTGHGSSSHDDGGSMPGMDMPETDRTGTGDSVARPRTLVLGGFGAFNAAVLVAAAVFRRRTAGERARRRDARAAAVATD